MFSIEAQNPYVKGWGNAHPIHMGVYETLAEAIHYIEEQGFDLIVLSQRSFGYWVTIDSPRMAWMLREVPF